MELCKGFVCSETLRKLLMRHAQSRFSIFWGGQTATGKGASFWNIVRHSFTINFVLDVFLRGVPIRTYVVTTN